MTDPGHIDWYPTDEERAARRRAECAEAVAAERERIRPFMDTIREALRIGAICFDGDSWFVGRDALGDTGYDDLDDAEKMLADARSAVLAIIDPEDTDATD